MKHSILVLLVFVALPLRAADSAASNADAAEVVTLSATPGEEDVGFSCTYPNGSSYKVTAVTIEAYDNGGAWLTYRAEGSVRDYWSPAYDIRNTTVKPFLDSKIFPKTAKAFAWERWKTILLEHVQSKSEGKWQIVSCQ